MFKFRKADVLNELDEYLQLNADEPARWLAREVRGWCEFSYDELAALIASGDTRLINWQSRYAQVVNERFNPLWLAAIQAASHAATRGRITIDDSDIRVKEFLCRRAAEFVQQLSDESKRAVASVILYGQSERLAPRDIAKLVRPLIGLNSRQAQANVNYRERVYNKLIDAGLSPSTAATRADTSAARYAAQQHRQRAETIVHTELARAYNQGAYDGVRAAIDARLMNHCEMVWSTAGTNRVCGRCLSLKDTVVGRTDEVGVTLPPLHPRCRCVIVYREGRLSALDVRGTSTPLTSAQIKEIRDAEDKAFRTSTGADFGFTRMKTPPDWSREITLTNGTGGVGHAMNCQRCVVAHEARMRGYDVIARPSWGDGDPMLTVREWLKVFSDEDKEICRCRGDTPAEIEKFIVNKMIKWGTGSRAFVWFERADNAFGHVIVAQLNERGFVNFGDPQIKSRAAFRQLNEAKFDSVKLMRVDNLGFTELVKRCCVNRSERHDRKRGRTKSRRISHRLPRFPCKRLRRQVGDFL